MIGRDSRRDPSREVPLIVTAITASMSAVLIRGQLSAMRDRGFSVALVSSFGREVQTLAEEEQVPLYTVEMRREISPFSDLKALIALVVLFRKLRPTVVNAGTPKASLLCLLAAKLTGVPLRIYTIRGLRYSFEFGLFRRLLLLVERFTSSLAHEALVISPSILSRCHRDRVLANDRGRVIGLGSSNGIDLSMFKADSSSPHERSQFRQTYRIPLEATVIGFVGRIVVQKGIEELVVSFKELIKHHPSLYLLVAGPLESPEQLSPETLHALAEHPRIVSIGFVENVRAVFSAMDILAHPAYGEGFGNVLLQASSMGKPIVTTDVDGVCDATIRDVTALVVPPRDVPMLTSALSRYIEDPALRELHGKQGIEWARRFDRNQYWDLLAATYRDLLNKYLNDRGLNKVTSMR